MVTTLSGLAAELFPPETAKFKRPLLLVHGPWTGSWCWREWATHFANLGWECWAINWRGRQVSDSARELAALTLDQCVEDVRRAIRALSSPVVLAHSFGGLIALRAAYQEPVSALIFVSGPLTLKAADSKTLRSFRLKYSTLIFFRRPFLLQEKDLLSLWLSSVPQTRRRSILSTMVPESPVLIRDLLLGSPEPEDSPLPSPTLLVGGLEDALIPISALRQRAIELGAERLEYPDHGHWLIGEDHGEQIVRDIHRWVIRKLGQGILLAEFPQP
jgi:pimeloyl-ACP methyl ester carboxylesterase